MREKNADDPIYNFANSLFIMTGLFLGKRSIILNVSIKAITKPILGETIMNIKFFSTPGKTIAFVPLATSPAPTNPPIRA